MIQKSIQPKPTTVYIIIATDMMMKYFGIIFLVLITINLVLCMHLPHKPRQQRSSGNSASLSLPSMEKIRYSNNWAVEIHGGSELADQIARRFGFINLGQVKLTI